MAQIHIYPLQSGRTPEGAVRDAQGRTIAIPFLRAFTMLRIGGLPEEIHDAIIDTAITVPAAAAAEAMPISASGCTNA